MVYQAYRPSIARYALANQRFGGEFSFDRMSWIKPNFMWFSAEANEHLVVRYVDGHAEHLRGPAQA